MKELAQDLIRELFDYQDGQLFWKQKPNRKIVVGSKAGRPKSNGYEVITINGSVYLSHRLVFLWHHGYLPDYIDHIDGDKLNNRIDNLRECSLSQNQCNKKIGTNNTSGYKGVYFSNQNGKWQVGIQYKKRKYHGGLFDDVHEAGRAAEKLRNSLHKEFARNI
jgi:hypothetical protein